MISSNVTYMLKRKKVKAEKQDESIDVVEDIETLTFWSSSKILLKNKGKFLKSFTTQYRLKPFRRLELS